MIITDSGINDEDYENYQDFYLTQDHTTDTMCKSGRVWKKGNDTATKMT